MMCVCVCFCNDCSAGICLNNFENHDFYLSDMSAHSMAPCSKLRVSAHPRECHLEIQTLRCSVNMQGPHAQRSAATCHLCRCLWFQSLTFAQRSFQHGDVRSVRLSNKGVPMFCPFAKAQERHCGGMFGKYSTSDPRCQEAKGLASCFVLAANANRGARQTAPNATLPSLTQVASNRPPGFPSCSGWEATWLPRYSVRCWLPPRVAIILR